MALPLNSDLKGFLLTRRTNQKQMSHKFFSADKHYSSLWTHRIDWDMKGCDNIFRSEARSKRRFIYMYAPNLTDELRVAFESVWFGRLGLEWPTTLNSAGSVALCDVGAAGD